MQYRLLWNDFIYHALKTENVILLQSKGYAFVLVGHWLSPVPTGTLVGLAPSNEAPIPQIKI